MPDSFTQDPESLTHFSSDTSHDEGTRAAVLRIVPKKWRENMVSAHDFRTTVRIFKSLAAIASKLIFSF